jgi:hypothetical protein
MWEYMHTGVWVQNLWGAISEISCAVHPNGSTASASATRPVLYKWVGMTVRQEEVYRKLGAFLLARFGDMGAETTARYCVSRGL